VTLSRHLIVFIFLMEALLLTAGCAGQAGAGKSAGNVPSTVLISSSIPAPTEIETYQVPPDGYWIKIDPISDKSVGEIFTIASTTNLPTGEEIIVQIYSSTFKTGAKFSINKFYGATGNLRVVRGTNGINIILFVVNTSELKPDEYIVTKDAVIQPVTGTALFNVLPAPDSYGKTPLKPRNFIDWEKLDLPPLQINNSMQPEIPKLAINLFPDPSQPGQLPRGSIVVFSPDSIVRVFDKNGTQIAAYLDFNTFRSAGVPSGSVVHDSVGNVSTVTFGGERILTMIHEAGD